jgi:hypothetical protein
MKTRADLEPFIGEAYQVAALAGVRADMSAALAAMKDGDEKSAQRYLHCALRGLDRLRSRVGQAATILRNSHQPQAGQEEQDQTPDRSGSPPSRLQRPAPKGPRQPEQEP